MLSLGLISETFISVGIWIVVGIYHVASVAFELFLILAAGELVSPESYQLIIENFYVVIGVVMLFFLAFSLLKGMVNPDDQKQGTETVKKVIVNLISSAIILVLLPSIFAFAFDLQDALILNQNTIGKFFGYGTVGSTHDNPSTGTNFDMVKQGSYQIVNGVFTAFFNINGDECDKIIDNLQNSGSTEIDYDSARQKIEYCQKNVDASDSKTFYGIEDEYSFSETSQYVEATGSFGAYTAFAENVDNSELDFNFLLSLIGGLLLIYVGVSFCFDMAVRLVKLVFYQLIAPIPLFMRVVPNTKFSDIFSNWTKVTLTCYLEVYIRIIVFYFCIFLCNAMMKSGFLSEDVYQYGWFLGFLAKAFVVMGIITFMRQAPKLFSEVTGIDSGNMKLGIRDKLAAGGAFVMGGAIGGATTAGLRNLTGAAHNIKNRWQQDSDKGVKTSAKIGHALLGVGSGAKSVIGGTGSGLVRGGHAGLNAKTYGDMAKAAGKGAQGAVDARVKRANYRAAHSGGKTGVAGYFDDLGRVGLGHIMDAGAGLADYAGIKNAEQMKRENYAMDTITSARDTFDNDTDSLIMKELAKGKSDIAGISISSVESTKRNLENKRANGTATKADEEAYNRALREARFQLQNMSLVSDKHWKGYSDDVRAKLSSLRVDAVKYKGSIRNNASLDPLREAGIVGAAFADDVDFTLGAINSKGMWDDVGTIDEMNKAIKRQKGTNSVGIAQKEQQRYEEKK